MVFPFYNTNNTNTFVNVMQGNTNQKRDKITCATLESGQFFFTIKTVKFHSLLSFGIEIKPELIVKKVRHN